MLHIPLLDHLDLQIKTIANKRKVWDIVRKKWLTLNPEEMVRQALLHYFAEVMQYPVGLIAVERQVKYGSLVKRYDIVVYNRQQQPWMLVECKAPEVSISEKTLHQLLQYQSQVSCPYWLLTNGIESYCACIQGEEIGWLAHLPEYE